MKYEELIVAAKNYEFDEQIHKKDIDSRNEFKRRWPEEKIKTMTLEEYCGAEKDNFCYWLEFKEILAGIGGGSSFKFGIYNKIL
jgi:5-methylcytosine-specific restriction protein B